MILQKGWSLFPVLTLLITLGTFYCTTQSDLCGNSTQVGNGRITGCIYQPDGSTPAKNAVVYVRKKSTLADITLSSVKQPADSILTDDSGRFITDSLDTDLYIIEATDRKNAFVLIDSIVVNDTDARQLPPATLKKPGAIKGTIKLSDGSDPRKVFVLAFGLDRFVTVDQQGGFLFGQIAEGTYHLRIMPTLDNYGIFDITRIPVLADDTFDIGIIELPFTGLPIVRNVTVAYDTLSQWVKLQWSRPATGAGNYFNIYRREVEPATAVFSQLNRYPVIDTIFIDSSGTPNRIYEYRITVADSVTAGEGAKSEGVRVRIALYPVTPDNARIVYDTLHQRVTLLWSNPDTARVKSFNIYRRNVDRNEVFWTQFNDKPIIDTFFTDSTFVLCKTNNSVNDDSSGLNESSYEYCIAALIHNVQEGVRSRSLALRTSLKYQTPSKVNFTYDTLKQTVYLRWCKPDMTIIQSFALFRRNVETNDDPIQINGSLLTDTFYIDSSAEQHNCYEYRVASVVKKDRAVIKSTGVTVRIAASFIEDTIYCNRGSGIGALNYPNDITVASDGDVYVVDQGNGRIQVFDSTLRWKKQIGAGILDYPLKLCIDNKKNIVIADYNSSRDNSSVYIFDSAGTVIDTLLDSSVINDLDVKNNILYTLTDSRTISIHAIDGSTLRSWRGSGLDGGKWIVAGDSGRVFVNSGSAFPDKNRITVYDSTGTAIDNYSLPYYSYSLAVDTVRQLLYTICYNGVHSAMLHVFTKNKREIASYKIKSDDQNISIGLHPSGAVFLSIKSESTILKLKPLPVF
ncbi:MAG: hypothetical protein ACM31E_01095 [Fibrobacterota bacterium]|nr:hypothetical protein [Chitinispirillaceae bacterium]